jgi:hypothetical protein
MGIQGVSSMASELSTHVGLATLALLCYRLLFCSSRELSLTALVFCAACAWCAGQLAAAAGGREIATVPIGTFAAHHAAAAARAACSSVLFSSTAREVCWNYTAYFAQDEPAP